ncbi:MULTISPECIES: NAD(P)H-dependent glycerol-3-phosphate dehydrogenase [Alteromonadaceae]|uniref:NAD(P)H-dependent glycerol-3-phosphate dehydrogenase n=1 Tax=Alteromonadaceae TaxID=72275 RepID=UPI001C0A6551|nr:MULTISPECIES: NAD(P)H-dependent glycerol-3-phosphate dehydrogenase [Aliiglaciecola]MBU2878510.1 NAD(P)H-dependent glycerol-3-phosphate dehydrogenase [Aliiglaciecola lipolytica]MDO6709662.1 NAD(P)H-dependent glycerol-3-phosphate dehydrogenase [Aliiglaciecola sp. 2_MG-2023]MDO6750796.1 NAD(P)H-dependent glycerol-3-phosphate dehydrogenase [Aliiglaciecola sp. 1_MG-2023]
MTMLNKQSVTVLGAGSYGTALAFCLARNEVQTYLWGRDTAQMKEMQTSRCNQRYLPEAIFPDALEIIPNLASAIANSQDILVVVPSHAFAQTLTAIKPFLTDQHRLIWATKGLEPKTGRLLQEVAEEVLGSDIPLAVLSGPTFAKEMVAGLPTAISLSSTDELLAEEFSAKLHCSKSFRVYKNPDFIGVQLGGAVKNVIAIGAGLSDGLGFGANARTALITRGLAELTRLGLKMGAKPETFMGMAGLGDLVLTCTDNQSRNRRFGLALGTGKSVEDAIDSIGQVVEGYRNAEEVKILADKLAVEMPITEQIYQVLYQGKPAKSAALTLLGREPTVEG